jgi:hypothetical protein
MPRIAYFVLPRNTYIFLFYKKATTTSVVVVHKLKSRRSGSCFVCNRLFKLTPAQDRHQEQEDEPAPAGQPLQPDRVPHPQVPIL